MTLLILGLLLWVAAHLMTVYGTGLRAGAIGAMGEGPYKGVYALTVVAGLILMIIGYRGAAFIPVFDPPGWTWHLNNLLMVIAVLLFAASHSKGNAKRYVRHPQLLSVTVWGAAHLIVNGDLASVILFGGLTLWALVSIPGINARDGAWVRPDPAPRAKDALLIAIAAGVLIVTVVIHWSVLGVRPFPG